MFNLAILYQLLKKPERNTEAIAEFLNCVGLFLLAGYDLTYSWAKSVSLLRSGWSPQLQSFLDLSQSGLAGTLTALNQSYPHDEIRVWFGILKELHEAGAGLSELVFAFADNLHLERSQKLEHHVRVLPTKLNILFLLFFFPPLMILLLGPLLFELIRLSE